MSLVITDIVVELEDKSLANIEVQKLGYLFTGERASCYSADLLLRQYKRLKDKAKSKFSYKDIAPVYTIVFLESSPACFGEFKNEYVHRFSTTSNTGLSLNMLQNFIFIPIDSMMQMLPSLSSRKNLVNMSHSNVKNTQSQDCAFLCMQEERIIRSALLFIKNVFD